MLFRSFLGFAAVLVRGHHLDFATALMQNLRSMYSRKAGASSTHSMRFARLDCACADLCLILLIALVSAAVAQTPTKELFPVTETTLTNGLRILTLEDHNCPIVAVQLWYRVGSADEPPGRHGFAHLFEHMMLRDGPARTDRPFGPDSQRRGQ